MQTINKFSSSLLLLFMCNTMCILAEPASPDTFNIIQPDSTSILVRLLGDEWFNWESTEDNIPIIKNKLGVYEYAIFNDSTFMPSGVKARNPMDRDENEKSYISNYVTLKSSKELLSNSIHRAKQKSQEDRGVRGSQIPNATGTLRFVTILMDFPDNHFIYSQTNFDSLMNYPNYTGHGNHGSVYDYYYDNSCHKLITQSIVVGPFRAQHNFEYYTSSDSRTRTLIKEAVNASKSLVDYSLCDNNNDGYVDVVHVVFAGHAASLLPAYQSIWPHYSSLILPIYDDGKKIQDYIITAGYNNASGVTMSAIGTICHELGHALGAPDFYDNDATNGEYTTTGQWDVMAGGNHNYSRRCPAMHNPYTISQIFHWRNIENITSRSTPYTLLPVETSISQKYYRLNTSTPNEYFLLENRQTIDWDNHVNCIEGGLLIYHIHANIGNVSSHYLNDTHPLHCYIVNSSATTEPNSEPASYGNLYYAAYPGYYNKRFFNAVSIPRAQSWAGNATTYGLYYIQKVGNNIQFMVNPAINGNASLCNSGQYSLPGIPSSATINWSYETDIQQIGPSPIIHLSSTTSPTITVQRGAYHLIIDNMVSHTTKLYSGYVTLKATVVCEGDTNVYTKTLFMHEDVAPTFPIGSLLQIGWQESRTFTINNCTDVYDNYLKWVITMPNETTSTTYYGRSKTITPTHPGTLNIKLYNLENCSTALHSNYNIVVDWRIPVEPILLFPNPVTTETVEIHVVDKNYAKRMERGDAETPQSMDYTLELWDDNSRFVKKINSTLKEEEDIVRLDVSGLQNGIYILILKVDDKVYTTTKMIINH